MIVAVLALLGGGVAFAEEPVARLVSVGLGGGVSVPVGDVKGAFDSGFNGHGFVKFHLPAFPIQPRLDLVFQKMDVKDAAALESQFAPSTYVGGSQQEFGGLAQAQFDVIKAGPIKPYLVAGLGVSSFKTSLDTDTGSTASQNQTEFTVSGGGGVLAKLGPVSAYVEGRVNNIVNNGTVIDVNSIKTVPISFGIVL
jgi:opacity protein-like surface antigen